MEAAEDDTLASGQLRMLGSHESVGRWEMAEDTLRASEERFRLTIEDAPVGMALLNLDGSWVKVNAALCNFLGYREAEFLELDFQSITHPDDLQADLDLVDRLLSGEVETYQFEKRYIHKCGEPVWGLLSVSIARNQAGEYTHFIAQIQDINERKEMDRLKSEFVATVSHELRTPLTSIRGSLGLVMGTMADKLPSQTARLLSIAHKNCERLILLVNDILDLEKISSDSMRFSPRREDIAAQVLQATEINQAFADQYGVAFEIDHLPQSCIVHVDQARLQQVLGNLLSNAAKFSPAGGSVRIAVDVDADRVRASISDRGPGILPEFRPRIFKRFSQANASATREKGGTGLGLHISEQIIQKMGGSIGFDSTAGEGSTFWIEFPCERHPEDAGSPQERGNGTAKALRPLPIALHVEDDADFSEFLSIGLGGQLHLRRAPTLAIARELLEQERFDMLILDPELPDGSGLELLGQRLGVNGDIPVVVLSASEMNEDGYRVSRHIVKSRVADHKMMTDILGILTMSRSRAHP